MFLKEHYVLCALFLLLLTIILFGLGKAVIKMAFSSGKNEHSAEAENKKLSWTMYLTQLHKFKELAQSLGRDRVKNKEHGGPERCPPGPGKARPMRRTAITYPDL